MTLDATVNPDFSQVESDAFQIQVNQRFPIFFSEKRPFFMEGMGLFNIARGNNMRTAVHTRRIVDPIFGAKLTGTVGKTTFGVLNAHDDHPGDVGDRGDEFADRNKLFTIGRATYALRRSDYVGGIVTQTQHAGRSNFATGADSIDPAVVAAVGAGIVPDDADQRRRTSDTHGNAAQLTYNYETRRFQTDRAGRALRSRFPDGHGVLLPDRLHQRLDLQRGQLLSAAAARISGCSASARSCSRRSGTDRIQDGDENFFNTGVRFNFTRQGNFNIEMSRGEEAWQGQQFKAYNDIFMFAGMQAVRWLNVFGGGGIGPGIYYDDVDPFQGDRCSASSA